ncbi:uncharacterized protein KQ657_001071 [Scheffersomyces spartinae]|uniref:Uncharacterized protein n=1 Tax=Scheffersomyces spartinae TaxID=45513 RepID=A0A9P7V806_9ASCO|nr:uncharacterized protein KQ657_001071 [Scheffersomyces spartinae]KAG7192965.1 hypothetical protein KQ657_001071 [Scheffersomyces spartinae]
MLGMSTTKLHEGGEYEQTKGTEKRCNERTTSNPKHHSSLEFTPRVGARESIFHTIDRLHDTSESSIDPFQSPLLKRSKSLSLISRRPSFLRLGQRLKKSKSVHFDNEMENKLPFTDNSNKLDIYLDVSTSSETLKEVSCAFDSVSKPEVAKARDTSLSIQTFNKRLGSLKLIPKDHHLSADTYRTCPEDSGALVSVFEEIVPLANSTQKTSSELMEHVSAENNQQLIEVKEKKLDTTNTENIQLKNKIKQYELALAESERRVNDIIAQVETRTFEALQLKEQNSNLSNELTDAQNKLTEITSILQLDPDYSSSDPAKSARKLVQQKEDLQRQLLEFNETFNTEMVKLKNDLYTLENELHQFKKNLKQILLKHEGSKDYFEEDIEAAIERFIIDATKWRDSAGQNNNDPSGIDKTWRNQYVSAAKKIKNYEDEIKDLKFELNLQADRTTILTEKVEQSCKADNCLRERIIELEKQNLRLKSSQADNLVNLKVFEEFETENKQASSRIESFIQDIILKQRACHSATETQLELMASRTQEYYAKLDLIEQRNKAVMDENNTLKDLSRTYLGEISHLKAKAQEKSSRIKTLIKTNKTLVQAHSTLISRCLDTLRPVLTPDALLQLNIDHEALLSKDRFSEKDLVLFVRVIHLLTKGISEMVEQNVLALKASNME